MELTCINCPVGCRLTVQMQAGAVVEVSGNQCKRGDAYARQECVAPQRMLTAVIPVRLCKTPLPVKTRTPVPKERIQDCMAELAQVKITAPVKAGQVVISNICGTNVDVIATKTLNSDENNLF